jgi:hypothetical protein
VAVLVLLVGRHARGSRGSRCDHGLQQPLPEFRLETRHTDGNMRGLLLVMHVDEFTGQREQIKSSQIGFDAGKRDAAAGLVGKIGYHGTGIGLVLAACTLAPLFQHVQVSEVRFFGPRIGRQQDNPAGLTVDLFFRRMLLLLRDFKIHEVHDDYTYVSNFLIKLLNNKNIREPL